MEKYIKKAAAIILALTMLFALCACHENSEFSTKAPVPDYKVCLDFSHVEEEEIWDEGSGALIFTKSICIPELVSAGSEKALTAINEDIAHQYEFFEEAADAIKNAALSLADENAMPNDEFGNGANGDDEAEARPCEYRTNATLNRGDVGVISLSYDTITYSGGAHAYVSRTSVSYDAKTGEKLSLESISDEPELLNQLVYGYILNISAGEKYKNPAGESIFFNPDLTESLNEIIESENWFFSNEGLVFFADPYELASFNYGRIDFVIPYAAMDGLLKEEYLPVSLEGENGMILAQSGDRSNTSELKVLDTIFVDDEGQSVLLAAEDTVYSVEIILRSPANNDRLLWYRNYMTTDEAVELLCCIPGAAPSILLRYILADGTIIERGILKNAEDGSIILAEPAGK